MLRQYKALEFATFTIDDQSHRTVSQIIYGCITTLFICIWSSIHPNVPMKLDSQSFRTRKLQLMILATLTPELVVGWAARQLLTCRRFQKKFDISVTQAWFVTMTGFCSRGGVPLVREEHLNRPEYRDEIKATPTEYILDKSKADITVKGVAIAKVIIFLVKYTARVAAGLAITPLEATTLAYTIIGLALWAIWWNKPFEVQIAIPVGPSDASEEDTGAFYAETYLDRLLSGADLLSQPSSTSVPSSWSFGPRDRDPTFNFTVVLNTVVGTGFGLLHLVCPNVVFASPTETALWYTAGALVAGLPILVFGPTLRKLDGTEGDWVSTAVKTRILVAVRTIAVVLYMVGRALLLALPLIALRSVPPAALTDIDSLSYL